MWSTSMIRHMDNLFWSAHFDSFALHRATVFIYFPYKFQSTLCPLRCVRFRAKAWNWAWGTHHRVLWAPHLCSMRPSIHSAYPTYFLAVADVRMYITHSASELLAEWIGLSNPWILVYLYASKYGYVVVGWFMYMEVIVNTVQADSIGANRFRDLGWDGYQEYSLVVSNALVVMK